LEPELNLQVIDSDYVFAVLCPSQFFRVFNPALHPCAGVAPRDVRGRGDERFAAHDFRPIFARRMAEVKINAGGGNADAVTLATEQDKLRIPNCEFRIFEGNGFGDFADGMVAWAPWGSAVARKSRWASAGNSAGVRRVSIFILRRAKDAKAAKEICSLTKVRPRQFVDKSSGFMTISSMKTPSLLE
jgi:hypothetical protein